MATMRVKGARDFLVGVTEEQTCLEGVPLSDIEKRMMYFTEGKDAEEDPASLNEEFQSSNNDARYEQKISGLMTRAYKRIKKSDPKGVRKWSDAMRTLRRGDHYLLVLAGNPLKHTSLREKFAYFFLFAIILSPVLILMLISPGRLGSPPIVTMPFVPNRLVLQVLLAAFIAMAIFAPRVLAKPVDWLFVVFEQILGVKD